MKRLLAISAIALAVPAVSMAEPITQPLTVAVTINGTVEARCSLANVDDTGAIFDLGEMIGDNGKLRPDLSAPPVEIAASWCNSASRINVEADPLEAITSVPTLPANFSDRVNFTAAVSGWTSSPATYDTAAGPGASSSQVSAGPVAGGYEISIADFATENGDNYLLADAYKGEVRVTIAPQ